MIIKLLFRIHRASCDSSPLGQLVLTPEETAQAEQQAAEAQTRGEKLAAMREPGIDPDAL